MTSVKTLSMYDLGDLLQTSAEILLAAALKEPVHTYRYR